MPSAQPSLRVQLRVEVNQRLFPAITALGFSPVIPSPGHDHAAIMPGFQRRHQDNLELLEVQFDKGHKPQFVINLGVVPPSGVTLPWQHFEQNQATISLLENRARLCRQPTAPQAWFKPSLLPRILKSPRAIPAVIDEVISLLPQADAWLRLGTIGPNIKLMHVPIRVKDGAL